MNIATRYITLATLGVLILAPGCYDGDEILERVRNDAIKSRLEEMDLGEFHATLPRDQRSNEMNEVFVHVFGAAVRYRLEGIRQKLQEDDHVLKQRVLLALRESTNEDFAEPDLGLVRGRLKQAFNSVLGDTPIEMLGFYDIRLVRH